MYLSKLEEEARISTISATTENLTEQEEEEHDEEEDEDYTEIELLLETYLKLTEEIGNIVAENIAHLKSTEDIVNLALDSQRNRLLLLELKLNIGMLGITGGTMMASFFGMNLLSGIEESIYGFGLATGLSVITTSIILKLALGRLQKLVRTRL
jgi:magnesium transporter